MRRTKEAADQTREDIFRAGIRVFGSKGYASASLADVAREAGVSRGAIYWHFKSKAEFVEETTKRLHEVYRQNVSTAMLEDATAIDVIARVARQVILRFVHDPEYRMLAALVLRESMAHGTTREAFHKPSRQEESEIVALFRQAIDRGEIHETLSAELAYFAINAQVAGIFLMILDMDKALSDAEVDHLADMVARGFAPECATTRSTT